MTTHARPAREARTYGGETRELILKAAEKLFAAQGLHSVSMLDIAAEAGVSRATVFNQFGSKILVLDAITARSLESYRTMLRAALDDTQAPTAALLRRLFRQMGKGIAGNQNLYREVFVELRKVSMGLDGDGVSPGLKRETFGILTMIFTRGQGRGDISRAASAEVLATAFDSLLSGAVIQWLHAQRRGSLPALLEALVDVFLDGAAA
jgi:AcrR family transcriptional regulator